MSEPAFDTLDAARRLETAGFETGRAEAIVEVMRKSVHQLVTREHFDAVIGKLDARIDAVEANLGARINAVEANLGARIDKLDTRIDAVQAELGAHVSGAETRMMRAMLIAVSVLIAAMALMMMAAGIFLA